MLKSLFVAVWVLLIGSGAFASATRTLDADALRSSDHSKSYTLPAATDTLVGRASSDSLSNKTISGTNNTLSALPVAADVAQETPSGAINSSNTSYSLSQAPITNASLRLFLDGLLLTYTVDYTLSGSTINMVTAPTTGQSLRAVFNKY
jgi:hypothetical protein